MTLPYHWDDRAKLSDDYRYLAEFHERLLHDLTDQLNRIHHVDHTLRYWRILVGPWLGYFIQMLFDRWECVHRAVTQYEPSATTVLRGHEETLVPNDMADFEALFVGDAWNHYLFALILQRLSAVPCLSQEREPRERSANAARAAWKQRVKSQAASSYARAASVLTREHDAFFLATYLPLLDEMLMHWRLQQVPQRWRPVPPIQAVADSDQREWILEGDDRSEFESCARALIPRQIPTAYLEGYERLVDQSERLPWPRKPKVIWTSNSQNSDDVFKAWAAERVEQGSPLVIGQHGGHYGTGRWCFLEDHDVAISDRYLSWGWSDPQQRKVHPVGQFKLKRPSSIRYAEQSRALLVTLGLPRFSYCMYSACVSRQWLDYFDDLCALVEDLPPLIRDALIVRLYPQDFGWDQVSRWRERFPRLSLDIGKAPINDLIRQSRIYISTYNATTYLEAFTMDVPTIIYWNPKHWELRGSAIADFEDLKQVGIFHETAQSAASQIAAIWEDVDGWWRSQSVRDVLNRFKRRYCDLPDALPRRLEQALREVITAAGRAGS